MSFHASVYDPGLCMFVDGTFECRQNRMVWINAKTSTQAHFLYSSFSGVTITTSSYPCELKVLHKSRSPLRIQVYDMLKRTGLRRECHTILHRIIDQHIKMAEERRQSRAIDRAIKQAMSTTEQTSSVSTNLHPTTTRRPNAPKTCKRNTKAANREHSTSQEVPQEAICEETQAWLDAACACAHGEHHSSVASEPRTEYEAAKAAANVMIDKDDDNTMKPIWERIQKQMQIRKRLHSAHTHEFAAPVYDETNDCWVKSCPCGFTLPFEII